MLLLHVSIMQIIFDVKTGSQLSSAVRSYMEHEWFDVVKSGQKVKMKFKDDFTSGTVDRVLFVSKQAANSTYFYATAKVIIKLSNNSTCEVQFRDMYL